MDDPMRGRGGHRTGHRPRSAIVAAALLACVGTVGAPSPAAAAGPLQWLAQLDRRSPPSLAIIRQLGTGTGTSLHVQVSGLRAGSSQSITIRTGGCAATGTLLASLGTVRGRADGQIVWTQRLSTRHAAKLVDATKRGGTASLRVGRARCGKLSRGSIHPSPNHRIGIRVVDRTAEFYDRTTGRRWVPRGNNDVRLTKQTALDGGTIVTHGLFNTDAYDPVLAEKTLSRMHADGYNAVRVFLSADSTTSISDPSANRLSPGYLDNLVDYIGRARAHGLQVMVTYDWLPGIHRYGDLLGDSCGIEFAGANCMTMPAGGVAANALFLTDLIADLRTRGARFDAVWSWQTRNEMYFDSEAPPLSFGGGVVHPANGTGYDMAVPADRTAIMADSLRWYLDHVTAAVHAADPTALVSLGFLIPQEPNPARPGDPKVIDPRPAYGSAVDFVDVHVYPYLDLTHEQAAENYGLADIPPSKPVVFGELGAFRFTSPTALSAAQVLVESQVDSCARGVDGWLTWTWNLAADKDIWRAVEAGRVIEKALAPAIRPNPCRWGPAVRDIAWGRAATASSTLAGSSPAKAVDHDNLTMWNSGGGAPQWLEIPLDGPSTVRQILLQVSRFPLTGSATHIVKVRIGGTWTTVKTFSGPEAQFDRLVVLAPGPSGAWTGVTAVRVETTASDSWVSWWEVKVLGKQP